MVQIGMKSNYCYIYHYKNGLKNGKFVKLITKKNIGKIRGKSRKSHKIEISYDVSKLFFEILVSYEMLLHVRFFSRLHQVHLKKISSYLFKKLLFLRGQKNSENKF